MQDEHFLRYWNEDHAHLSAEVERLLNKLFARHPRRAPGIDRPYASEARVQREPLRDARHSLASGLAAVITTLAIFVTISALAFPSSADAASSAPALASVLNEGLLL